MPRTIEHRAPKLTVEQAHDQLIAHVESLTASAEWLKYLGCAAKFHSYSPNNIFLILIQRPEATRVAGFQTWKALGRSVKKGSSGIAILCPCVRNRRVENEQTGDITTRQLLLGFRIGYVFDVADTEGAELSDVTHMVQHPEGKAPAGMFEALATQVEAQGFSVRVHPSLDNSLGMAWGRTDYTNRTVTVRSTADPAGCCKTLAHELAHVMLHEHSTDGCRGTVEIEAESVAYIVSAHFGLDTSAYSAGYLASWSGGSREQILATASRVLTCAKAIVTTLQSAHDVVWPASALSDHA
jgi:hypothetical protein